VQRRVDRRGAGGRRSAERVPERVAYTGRRRGVLPYDVIVITVANEAGPVTSVRAR